MVDQFPTMYTWKGNGNIGKIISKSRWKIIVVNVHMEEQALTWWKIYNKKLTTYNQHMIDTWDAFKHVYKNLNPSTCKDAMLAQWLQLQQTPG